MVASEVFDLLRSDATVFTTISTREQKAEMEGVSEAMLVGDQAMWAGSDEDREWQRREKARLLEEHVRVWGRPPDQFQ